jgi:hypothetical protein
VSPQNAFESWLHPDRYKTTLCSYAGACTRKFCFFAHSAAELRQPTNKQHSAAAAGGMACHPDLRLTKMSSLDTNPSIGTPNSSSSNMSSSSAHGMHISWVPGSQLQVSVGNNAAAAAAAAAVMYVQQMQPMGGTATGIPVSSCLPGGVYLPMYQAAAQQQQQLMTAFIDSSNSSSMLAGPPGLSPVVMTSPQLAAAAAAAGNTAAAAAAAAPMQIGGGFAGHAAGMQLGWESLALAQLASLGTPMATDSSNFSSNSLLFDPASPSTPLTVNSISPVHSPMVAVSGMAANAAAAGNSSGMRIGSLQHAFDSSSQQQQQHNSQLRQQLLQHLMDVQQQKQPQQQQGELPADMGSNWSLASVDSNLAAMLHLNQQSLQLKQSNLTADQAWPQYALQQDQQQLTQLQQQQQAISGLDVQVLPGPQGFKPVGQVSAGQQDLGCGLTGTAGGTVSAAAEGAAVAGSVGSDSNPAAFLAAAPEATQHLQQQLNMLSFAMAQPA